MELAPPPSPVPHNAPTPHECKQSFRLTLMCVGWRLASPHWCKKSLALMWVGSEIITPTTQSFTTQRTLPWIAYTIRAKNSQKGGFQWSASFYIIVVGGLIGVGLQCLCCKILQLLSLLWTSSACIVANKRSWQINVIKWLWVGVVIMNKHTIDD